MGTRLSSKERAKLLGFIGYGNLGAPVWFIGMEERGHTEERLRQRLKFRRVEDLARAHDILGITKHHHPPFKLQPTWRTMCEIMLRLANIKPTRDNLKWYQTAQLGQFDSDTFLTELLPIPAPNRREWEFASLFGEREEYEKKVRPERIKMLRRSISKHKPSLVICYGRGDWKYYEQLFPEAEWEDSAPFRIGRDHRIRIFLTPHFVPYQMSKAQITKLCRSVREMLRGKDMA